GFGQSKPVMVFHKSFGWLKTNFYYADQETIKNIANKIASRLGRQLSLQKPNLNATLADGSRMNAIIPPISFTGPSITIRKFKKNPLNPINLAEFKTISLEALAFLWMALQTDSSMLIAGNTGSGKTTTMNALFNFVRENERIIVTEETPEINLPHKHIVKLNTVENLGVKMKDLIVETLRMRPDRVIVGEIRNTEEVEAFIDTLLAGQGKGSYATFHALSSAEVSKRMKKLGVMELDFATIDLILVQKRWNRVSKNSAHEIRRITEICEVIEKNNTATIRKLFSYNYKKDRLEKTSESIKVKEKILNCFGLNQKQYNFELKNREKFLQKMDLKEKCFFEKIKEYNL
ncbi:MAG: ATPase, T2SS/T4P/T4SS family, partial [Candidatus Diapherotrites archaeon]|nr:ATPase, T2SS/T4P/T4SS family [Candidatus Diapherotrites archaeon]